MYDANYVYPSKGIPLVSFFKSAEIKKVPVMFMHMHYHSDLEILYIECGAVRLVIGEKELFASSGDTIIINPYETHYGEIISCGIFSYYCIDIDIKLIGHKSSDQIINGQMCYPNIFRQKNIKEYIVNTYNAFICGNIGWDLNAKGNMCIFFSILENYMKNITHKTDIFAKKAIDYIDSHYSENITSKTAAIELGYDKSYFCRLFKKHFNMRFCDYLNLCRIKKSKEFLKNYSISVSSVMAGYSNPSYFSSEFKKITGMTPTRYKNSM